MVEKMVGGVLVPLRGLMDIRKGDVFRTTDGCHQGPMLLAVEDAKNVPHPKRPGQLVWAVKTQPASLC